MAKKKFQDLNLMDAFLFAAAMEDEEISRLTLQILLNRKVDSVKVRAEHAMLYSSDYRSIRLDVFAQDASGNDYNMEMQCENRGNLPKRSRFHQAEMDVMSIAPGTDFNDMQPSYVIFICTFDPFGKGLYQYTFENRCLECELPLEDGTTKIFLNTKGKNADSVSTELVNFLKYVENSTDELVENLQDDSVSKVHARVTTLKKSRDWESRYMKFEELLQEAMNEGREWGRQQGIEQGLQQGIEQGLQQGIEQGLQQGIEQGFQQGQERLLLLIQKMTEDGATNQLSRLYEDADFLQEMYLKYQV